MELDKSTYDRQNGILKTVAEHLKSQDKAARNEWGACVYRAPDGTKCAVGILIKDSSYNPVFEGASMVWAVPEQGFGMEGSKERLLEMALKESGINPDDFQFLNALQEAHDGAVCDRFWQTCRESLVRIADKAGLDKLVIPE